ncbi:MAG TPA: DUF1343 domain-containing protein [Ignavibacteriaceae bacterium]
MQKRLIHIAFILLVIFQSCEVSKVDTQVKSNSKLVPGDDALISDYLGLIKNKRLAIVANNASRLSNGTLLTDTLNKIDGINIKAIFVPEHGFNIDKSAGETISDSSYGSIPVYSLYGTNKKPTAEMLQNIDLIIFDLQDIGTRFYTYISTLYYLMESCAEHKIPLIVLDRPDPIGGLKVEGPVLDPKFESFIGIAPIPVIHGMTIGELANMFAGEKWAKIDKSLLKVIKMKNWRREQNFNELNLTWMNPSPNMPDAETALIYPATAFLEGTNISDGRGTYKPFKQIGAPFLNPEDIINELDSIQHPGVSVKPVDFTPLSIDGKADNPKFENQKCYGIRLEVTDPEVFMPVEFGIKLLYVLQKLYPEKLKFDSVYFDNLAGQSSVREMLLRGKTPYEIIRSWQYKLNEFIKIRTQYLLY